MPWVTVRAVEALADIANADLISRDTRTQRAVDERVSTTVRPLVADAIASDPTLAEAAAERAAEIAADDLGLLRSDGDGIRTVIGPEGAEDQTWLQYDVFGEPTAQSAAKIWAVLQPLIEAAMPRLVVGPSRPADRPTGTTWWIETDADGKFVALHEGRA